MRTKLRLFAGWLIAGIIRSYFWLDGVTKKPRMWMWIQWQRLWARFPVLKSDVFHSALTMASFIILLIGTSNDVRWLTFAGLIALSVTLILGTVNLIYDF